MVIVLAWLLLAVAWLVYVLGDRCLEGHCGFSHTERAVAVFQALTAVPGLIAAGFVLVQGGRAAFGRPPSDLTTQAFHVAGGVLAGWIAFLLLAVWL